MAGDSELRIPVSLCEENQGEERAPFQQGQGQAASGTRCHHATQVNAQDQATYTGAAQPETENAPELLTLEPH